MVLLARNMDRSRSSLCRMRSVVVGILFDRARAIVYKIRRSIDPLEREIRGERSAGMGGDISSLQGWYRSFNPPR